MNLNSMPCPVMTSLNEHLRQIEDREMLCEGVAEEMAEDILAGREVCCGHYDASWSEFCLWALEQGRIDEATYEASVSAPGTRFPNVEALLTEYVEWHVEARADYIEACIDAELDRMAYEDRHYDDY